MTMRYTNLVGFIIIIIIILAASVFDISCRENRQTHRKNLTLRDSRRRGKICVESVNAVDLAEHK